MAFNVSAILGILIFLSKISAQGFAPEPRCPDQPYAAIHGSQNGPDTWTTYHDLHRLFLCDSPMLVDFAVYNPLDDPETHVTIRATTGADSVENQNPASGSNSPLGIPAQVTFYLATWADDLSLQESSKEKDIAPVTNLVQNFVRDEFFAGISSIFAYSGGDDGVSVGVYIGSMIQKSSFAVTTLEKFFSRVKTKGILGRSLIQYCGPNADHVVGIVIDPSTDSLPTVQHFVRDWSDSKCADEGTNKIEWTNETIWLRETKHSDTNRTVNLMDHEFRVEFQADSHLDTAQVPLSPNSASSTCTTTQVTAGDSCGSLAVKCKVSPAEFTKFNPSTAFCSTLAVGQAVCCSAGSLPDMKPKPTSDGICAIYKVLSGDFCSKIAASNGLTVPLIESYNTNTWGWMGCVNVQAGQLICLSTGQPPLPAAVSGAICGPQVIGTVKPTGALESLNPCLLNACCNIWGQCGTVDEFCIPSKSITGAPGTSAPGTSGCISNCGTAIVNNAAPPPFFRSITYYEAWSMDRPCLNMEVSDIDTSKYTHIHFSFGLITGDYKVDISAVQDQFNKLVKMRGINRILSFGGWSFSTSQDSYPIFRESVSDQIRLEFANNVAAFVKEHNLDGVDFDWEYPGALDIPGLPPGGPKDGANYLSFLKVMRGVLPKEKTVSIAAPASYWYLKGFPIKEIAEVIDYIIYMTYDLHGQWDYGSPWASPGCTSGACLRSHVNLTETTNALSMITKAGVPAAKVIVGTSSYGRSFKMAQPGCSGPDCRFIGPDSAAAPGRCTQTPGYIADGEISDIIATNPSSKTYHDSASDSDILVYDDTKWVAYMDAKTKASRTLIYKTLKFGGTSDWAVDLGGSTIGAPVTVIDCMPWIGLWIDDLVRFRHEIPDYCVDQIIISGQSRSLDIALDRYKQMIADDYDAKFDVYSRFIRQLLPIQIDKFMSAHANEHFTCTIMKQVTCCRLCTSNCGHCDNSPDCQQGVHPVSTSCPADIPEGPGMHQSLEKYTFTVRNQDVFLAAVSADTGMPKGWVVLGERLVGIDPACWQGGPNCESKVFWHSYPIISDNVVIPNPKNQISSVVAALGPFSKLLANTAVQVRSYLFTQDTSEVIGTSMLPVIMLKYAVDSMALVVRTSDAATQEEQKFIISCFITAVLFLIPLAGEALEVVQITEIATFGVRLGQFGELAEIANTMREVLVEPHNWIQSIASYVTGIPLIDGPDVFRVAGEIWRENGQLNIAGLGSKVGEEVAKVNRMRDFCQFRTT